MSEYYRIVRGLILEEYKYFGIAMRIECIFSIISIVCSFLMILLLILGNSIINYTSIFFLLVLIVHYCREFFLKKRIHWEKRQKAIETVINTLDLNEKIVDVMLVEIKEYIKKVRSNITWFIGIIVSIFILFATIGSNIFQKVLDVFIEIHDKEELKKIFYDFNNIETYYTIIMVLINGMLFSIIVFTIFYYILGLCVLEKKSVLYFLYDVKYQLNMSKEQKEKINEIVKRNTMLRKIKRFINEKCECLKY